MFCLKITINSQQLFLSKKHAKKRDRVVPFLFWELALNKFFSEQYDGSYYSVEIPSVFVFVLNILQPERRFTSFQ
jgi:hypothetical protein